MTTNNWVVDASPIILLASIELLDLLRDIPANLCIPEDVATEILQAGNEDAATRWIQKEGRSFIRKQDIISPLISTMNLGTGEKSVLSFALSHKGWVAVIDDLAARKCAQLMGIPYIGTLGVILAAKRKGLIEDVEVVFDKLIDIGFYISPVVLEKAVDLSKQ